MSDHMKDLYAKLRIEDEIEEIKMRQQLRHALFAAYVLLTNPDAEPKDADMVTELVLKTLQDTTP